MSIYAKEGNRVVFAYPENGNDDDIYALRHLTEGETYTIDFTDEEPSVTYIYLKEFPQKPFNLVQFKELKSM